LLPSFGDSGILAAPATTENAARIFHEFVAGVATPLHIVAHDFGAWVAYSWALLFPGDFKSLTLIDAGIPGVTLTEDIQLSDYKRKWNFIFQMLQDLPAALTKGKEDIYVGWWFENKVYKPGSIGADDAAAYARGEGAWMQRWIIAARSSPTRISTSGSSKANCRSVFLQSGANTRSPTWESRRYSINKKRS
jgi:pimeloyl-ACP methyl ester carboxylesterase